MVNKVVIFLFFYLLLTVKVDELYTRRFIVGHSTSVVSSQTPSHSKSMGVLCSHCVIQHCLGSFIYDNGGVSGPSDSGSRSASGDTGESKL